MFASANQLDGDSTSPLPDAAPGDIIEIPIELTAHLPRGGTYVGNWMFSDPYGRRSVGATRKGSLTVGFHVNYLPAL